MEDSEQRRGLLKYRADRRSVACVLLHYALTIGLFIEFHRLAAWQIAIGVVVLCFSCFMVSVIVHNAIHVPLFFSRPLNKLFQYALSVGQGHPVTAFVPGHNFSHHLHTQSAKDIMRSSQVRFRWNFLNQFLFFFRVIPDILGAERKWAKKMRAENPRWYWQSVVETALVYGSKIGVLLIDWRAGLLLVWVPQGYGNWGIVGTNVWQHDGCVEGHPYNHSRSMVSPIVNFFAFNNGYHAAHHNAPGVHWSELPEYHAEHIEPNAHPSLIQPSLIRYLWRTNIWPGKREDLDGNPLDARKVQSVDWISEVDLSDDKYAKALGADPMELRPPARVSRDAAGEHAHGAAKRLGAGPTGPG